MAPANRYALEACSVFDLLLAQVSGPTGASCCRDLAREGGRRQNKQSLGSTGFKSLKPRLLGFSPEVNTNIVETRRRHSSCDAPHKPWGLAAWV